MNRYAILALLAWMPAASAGPGAGASPGVSPRCVAVLLTTEAPHANEILAGLAEGLRPAGYAVVRPALPPRGRSQSWKGTTDVLVRLLHGDGIRVFVVGPERDLCHLALQFAVKGDACSILIGCPDPDARSLPIHDSHHVAVPNGGRSEKDWHRAALEAARLVIELEQTPARHEASRFRVLRNRRR